MPYRTLLVTSKPQPLYVGKPLNTTAQLGVGWTLANNDQTNPVYVSTSPGVKSTDSDAIQVAPLGSIPIDPTFTSYVVSAGPSVQCFLMPGGGTWAPSPAQIAAQINALGLMKDTTGSAINTNVTGVAKDASVTPLAKDTTLAAQTSGGATIAGNISTTGAPLINLKSTTQIANGLTITAGTTTALTAVTGINQNAYNVHVTCTSGASSTKPWYTVTLKWIDTASGFTVQVDAYTAFMSSTSNVLSTVIAGPTDADQLQVSVTNNDTVTMTVNVGFVIISSRFYNQDYIYQFWTTAAMPAIATFQIGAAVQVPTQKILFSVNRTLGIGLTSTPDYALPVYAGPVQVHFDGTGSNNWDVLFTDQLTGTFVHRQTYTGAPALGNVQTIWPRSPVTCHFVNNGSVSGTLNCEVTAV
jgi:hypothetical protein